MASDSSGKGVNSSGGGGSSCVASWQYNAKAKQLSIAFVKGGSHSYSNVPRSLIDAFQKTSSHGKFFNFFIRNGGFG